MKVRLKAVIAAITTVGSFLLLQVIDLSTLTNITPEVLNSIVVSVLFLIGLLWVLNFRLRGFRILSLLLYPSFLVFIISLFLGLAILQNNQRISQKTLSVLIILLFAVFVYFLILTINILNKSYISEIPLAKAAKAANFIFTLFGAYLSFMQIFRAEVHVFFKMFAFFLLTFLFAFNLFWFKGESKRQLIGETWAVTFTMLASFVLLLMWPISVELAALFHIIVYYILVGLGLEERESTSKLMRLEYYILLLVVVFFVFQLTQWGVNGLLI